MAEGEAHDLCVGEGGSRNLRSKGVWSRAEIPVHDMALLVCVGKNE